MKNIDKKKLYMIIGIMLLILSLSGSAYAYFSATAVAENSISGTAAGGADLDLGVVKISTGANSDLIPLDNTTDMLTKAVIGYNNDSKENNKRCIDKNGYTVCQVYKITITNNGSIPVTLNGGVTLSGTNTPNIECAIMDNINTVTNNKSCKGDKTLANKVTLNGSASKDYYIIVYIKNINGVQTDSGDFNGTIFFNVNGDKIETSFGDIPAAEYITKLYTNADKSTVVNNEITYNTAPSVNLMNDRLGGTTTSLDGGNIRYYGAYANQITKAWQTDASQAAAQNFLERNFTSEEDCISSMPTILDCSTNYSKFGFSNYSECEEALEQEYQAAGGKDAVIKNLQNETCSNITDITQTEEPIHNYIYFNCDDYSNQTSDTCELWRIIGVFDGKLKIMRNSPIGSYSWDTSVNTVNDGFGVNEWSQADLMKLLNPGYTSESVGGSLYYNGSSGTCYSYVSNITKSCNFTTTGIKNDTTQNKIATVVWNTGGNNFDNDKIYSDQWYSKERGTEVVTNPSDGITRQTTWSGKIALAYPSDYGYATDFTKCSGDLSSYGISGCYENNWMYPAVNNNGYGTILLLLTPESGRATSFYSVWHVYWDGYVASGYHDAADNHVVSPALFLNAEETIVEGTTGSSTNPYKLNP